ncbi:adhesion G protein-coupled receptor L4-like isoform X2 [Babylonia areolata]|uniref:adhesion G protein-coupled receptor L4-like isoform X2 n=1 Tax=Babylonia areolata TaxID=304850 RepID=UPI003FD581BE
MGISAFILVTGLLIVIGDQARKCEASCAEGWVRAHRGCYLFASGLPSGWNDSERDCEREGARLLSISSLAEMRAFRALLNQRNDTRFWWVGLERIVSPDQIRSYWRWLDGSPLTYRITPWKSGNAKIDGNCAEIDASGNLNGKNCTALRPFICEKRQERRKRPTGGNTRPDRDNEDERSDSDDDDKPKGGRSSGKEKGKEKENGEGEEDLYEGCYLPGWRGRGRGRNRNWNKSGFPYTPGSSSCPSMKAAGDTWPETPRGDLRSVRCKKVNGNMTFLCGGNPNYTCWQGVPNRDQCASRAFRNLLSRISPEGDDDAEAPEPEETVNVTSELANVTRGDDVTEEDIAATSKLIRTLVRRGAARKVKDKRKVKRIVLNVVKAGSNLVSRNKTRVWKRMARQEKIRSATSLLVAMETATVAMAEELTEPTSIVSKDDNIDMELRVVNVSSATPGGEEKEDVAYSAADSDTHFSIPLETLSHLSSGGLAKMVFMTHYTMGSILDNASDDDDDDSDDNLLLETEGGVTAAEDGGQEGGVDPSSLQLASHVVSATVAVSAGDTKQLPRPVAFTITHTKKLPKGFQSLCSFWDINDSGLGAWSQAGCRKVDGNDCYTQCECDHMTNFAVLMAVQKVQISEVHQTSLRVVTIVGCVISLICLLACWVTFTCFSSLHGERNTIHKNLVACLFVAELLFLIGIHQTENRVWCGIVAGCLHYFFLATFLWMLMEAVHIVLMLVQVFDASRSRLPYYYASAYGPPLLIIAISAAAFPQGYGTDQYCWLTTERGFIWSFAGPVAIILFVNSVILIYAMTMVCRHSDYVFSAKDKTSAGGVRSWIQGAMALEVVLGLTWVLGFFFLSQQTLALAYLFTVLNSTQGLFIFLFHCLLNKKARKEYRRVLVRVRGQPSSAGTGTGTGTGTHSASLGRNKLTSGPSFNRHNVTSQDSQPTPL